jgi:SOS response regulatory protein OraA/RecX
MRHAKYRTMDVDISKILLRKAGALLAHRAYSRGELKSKLAGLADEAQIGAVLNHLQQLNLLNDADYAYNFALHRIRQQGWSPAKAQHALVRRQVEMPVIERALERVQNEAGDQSAIIVEYIHKRCGKNGLPTEPKGVRKLILHLRQRGFDEDQILDALRRLFPAAALQPFETGE